MLASTSPPGRPKLQVRAAYRAGVRLGVEASIQGVLVLGPARVAHREVLHGRVGPVVGQALNDAEARAAVGAVGERVEVATVGGVEQLMQAIGAGGYVGQ